MADIFILMGAMGCLHVALRFCRDTRDEWDLGYGYRALNVIGAIGWINAAVQLCIRAFA